MDLIGNTTRAGQSTPDGLPLVMLGGDGDLAVYAKDNIIVDRWGNPLPERGRYTTGRAEFIDAPAPMLLPAGLPLLPARDVERYVLANAGARPSDRDRMMSAYSPTPRKGAVTSSTARTRWAAIQSSNRPTGLLIRRCGIWRR